MLSELLRVGPGPVDLAEIDPRGTPGLPTGKAVRRDPKAWARAEVADLAPDLLDLQTRLYASATAVKPGSPDRRRRLLLVLQAMDCGGKDGTIKRLSGAMNPQGMRITSFGPPTEEELSHPFLWRIERALPPGGYVGVFNRSHYEDVLIVRVHNRVRPAVWRRRYHQINRFEARLVDNGVTLVKVMLHISYQEQRRRLTERLTDPRKYWKYNPGDLAERGRWADYQQAYADALSRCSTEKAPWYVVPADRKWYRDWAVARLLVEALERMGVEYPPPTFDVEAERTRLHAGN